MVDLNCENLRKRAVRALRNFRTVQSLENYKSAKHEYRELIKKKKKKEKKDAYFKKQTRLLSDAANDNNPKAFWNMIKSDRKPVSQEVSSDDWYKYFLRFQPANKWHFNKDIINHHYEESSVENVFLNRPISENEIRNAIKNLKTGKSLGIDGIIIEFLKCCPDYVVPFLMALFNFYFERGYFPLIGRHPYWVQYTRKRLVKFSQVL